MMIGSALRLSLGGREFVEDDVGDLVDFEIQAVCCCGQGTGAGSTSLIKAL